MHPGDIIIFFPQLIHSIYKLDDKDNKLSGLDKSKPASKVSQEKDIYNPKYNLEHNSIMPVPEKGTRQRKKRIQYKIPSTKI